MTPNQKTLLAKTMHVLAWLFIIYAAFKLLAIADEMSLDFIYNKNDRTFAELIVFLFTDTAMIDFWLTAGLAMLFEWISASIRAGNE
jgi:hypothetical protein